MLCGLFVFMKYLLILTIALLAACGGGSTMPGNATPDPQGTRTPRPIPTPTPCQVRPCLSA